jgi:hypothetical protein
MNNRQNEKLNMFQATLDVCDSNSGTYQNTPVFTTAVYDFNSVVSEIRLTDQDRDKMIVQSASSEKTDYEDKLISISIKVGNLVYVYAFDNNDQLLLSLTSVNKGMFFSAEGNKKLSMAKNIHQSASAIVDKLLYYGVTNEMLDELQKAISNYEEIIVKPRDVSVVHKNYTYKLKTLFAKADSILYDKLDKLIVLFKDSHPDFYNEYKSARNVLSISKRHRKDDK